MQFEFMLLHCLCYVDIYIGNVERKGICLCSLHKSISSVFLAAAIIVNNSNKSCSRREDSAQLVTTRCVGRVSLGDDAAALVINISQSAEREREQEEDFNTNGKIGKSDRQRVIIKH
jgi:hypothetical protein